MTTSNTTSNTIAKNKPTIICAPEPRSIDLIFTDTAKKKLHSQYKIVDVDSDKLATIDDATLGLTRYILGQPPVSLEVLEKMHELRCVLNVESNLINNMPYDYLFEKGIHVVTTGAVFAEPVAELGLALALCLSRGVIEADTAFRHGEERWGGDGNAQATLLSRSRVGLIGFGDLGRAIARLLKGFRANISVFDPWLPPSLLTDADVTPASLEQVLTTSDVIFVVASVTSDNAGFLDAKAFSKMKSGARFILLSRAEIVNFDDLISAVESGHILAASDVYPEEPMPQNHQVRELKGFIRSAHRAGALDVAFKQMGEMVLEDMALMDKGLPPMRCKRAERETVSRMRSKPVDIN